MRERQSEHERCRERRWSHSIQCATQQQQCMAKKATVIILNYIVIESIKLTQYTYTDDVTPMSKICTHSFVLARSEFWMATVLNVYTRAPPHISPHTHVGLRMNERRQKRTEIQSTRQNRTEISLDQEFANFFPPINCSVAFDAPSTHYFVCYRPYIIAFISAIHKFTTYYVLFVCVRARRARVRCSNWHDCFKFVPG